MSLLLIELGVIILGLGVLARLATRLGLSAIPLYLLAGLAFGNGGLLPLQLSEDFVHLGAEIGVILLLFMLGLDHSADELATSLRSGMPSGIADLLLNFPPRVRGRDPPWLESPGGLPAGWCYLHIFIRSDRESPDRSGAVEKPRNAKCHFGSWYLRI